MYLNVRIIYIIFGVLLPLQNGFSKVKSFYITSAYYCICDDYSVNADETWMNWDSFYTTTNGVSCDRGKTTERFFHQKIVNQYKGFRRKSIE